MLIIKQLQDLNNIDNKIFSNFNFSFYAIYNINNKNLTVLQLFKTNDNKFQWFFIGKPFKMENKFLTTKEAIKFLLEQPELEKIIIVENKDYNYLIKILEYIENQKFVN